MLACAQHEPGRAQERVADAEGEKPAVIVEPGFGSEIAERDLAGKNADSPRGLPDGAGRYGGDGRGQTVAVREGDLHFSAGASLERAPGLLRVQIHLKGLELLGVPETDALLAVEYRREGHGNQAEVVVNGQRYVDEDVFIRSGRGARELRIPIQVLGMRVDRITLIRQGPGEALLSFRAGQDEHVLALTAAPPATLPDGL